jgi:hypothetical protein
MVKERSPRTIIQGPTEPQTALGKIQHIPALETAEIVATAAIVTDSIVNYRQRKPSCKPSNVDISCKKGPYSSGKGI